LARWFFLLFLVGGCAASGGPKVLSDVDFKDFVSRSGFVLVRFDAGLTDRTPFLEALRELKSHLRGAVCPLGRCPKTVASYRITKLPAYVLFRDGQQLTRRVGDMSKEELVGWVRRLMEAMRLERRR